MEAHGSSLAAGTALKFLLPFLPAISLRGLNRWPNALFDAVPVLRTLPLLLDPDEHFFALPTSVSALEFLEWART